MSTKHELMSDILECKTEKQLLRVVQTIVNNSKKWKLDEVDIQRLEEAGMRKYETMQRERSAMIKNKKQGFNNFD